MAEADSEWSTTIFRDCRKPGMPRPLRFVPENGLVEITTRTLQGRLLLRPSPELNDLILGVIGRAQDRYGMVIHAFVVTSNHAHYILSPTTAEQLARFMQFVNTNIPPRAGARHPRPTGWCPHGLVPDTPTGWCPRAGARRFLRAS